LPDETPVFEFLVEHTEHGWMVQSAPLPLGPFSSRAEAGPFFIKAHAIDLAEGMAASMRQLGDQVVVRVKD